MTFDHLAAAERTAAAARAHAVRVDSEGAFPAEAIAAAREFGLLGLMSAESVGGHARGLRQAAEVVELLGRECGSTAMVMTMHYSGAAVLEALAPEAVRRDVA